MEFLAEQHPLLVHFPIAFFFLYVLFEVMGYIGKKNWMNEAAFIILGLGIVCALLAMLTGNQAETLAGQRLNNSVLQKESITQLIREHENWATLTMFWFLGILLLRFRPWIESLSNNPITAKSRKLLLFALILGIIGLFFVVQTGEAGGKLVYIHGVGVNKTNSVLPIERVVE